MPNKNDIEIINKTKIKNPLDPPPTEVPEIPGDSPPSGSGEIDPEVIEPETDATPYPSGDIFAEFDGLLPDNVTYSIYRMGKSGKQEFVTFAEAPYSIMQIAQNFGGGDYLVMARDPQTGKYIRRKTISIARDVFDFEDPGNTDDKELLFLKKMGEYKKLFEGSSKTDTGFMEVMGKQMEMMLQMSSNMMLQQMEMMKEFQENMQDGGGDISSVVSLVEKYISGKNDGKIEDLPGKKKAGGGGE